MSIPLSLFIDTLGAINDSWVIPKSIFSFRFFGVATIEVYLYGLMWVLFSLLFYEHFFKKDQRVSKFSPHIKYLFILSMVLVSYTLIAFFIEKSLFHFPFFYLIIGIFSIVIPLVLFLYYHPSFHKGIYYGPVYE